MNDAIKTVRRPTLLIILDGFGINPDPTYNAIIKAETPNFDQYFDSTPMTALEASGRGVGLPEGQMGNSEVGHMTIGSGTIVKQDLVRIDDSIADGSLFNNAVLLDAMQAARESGRPLHLIGLVSDGGVHSHIGHLQALIDMCGQNSVKPQLHMITDGRDTAPQVAINYVDDLQQRLSAAEGQVATVSGRFYAMDRDNRWERVQQAWGALVSAEAPQWETVSDVIQAAYDKGLGDEFIEPARIKGMQSIQGGDQVVFFNFRNDRARQLSAALTLDDFDSLERGKNFQPVKLTTLTLYDSALPANVVFERVGAATTLGEILSSAGLQQFHCAETEKYAHVTFFFNGGREAAYPGEERCLVDSPKVATYDLQPEMSAREVADAVIAASCKNKYDFIVVNFANGDMVGHTAVQPAVIKAVETLDTEVYRVIEAARVAGYSVILTADHGNCDEMVDENGKPHTQHSTHPVPCLVFDDQVSSLRDGGDLSAIAPTVLQLMGVQQPPEMTGTSLISGTLK